MDMDTLGYCKTVPSTEQTQECQNNRVYCSSKHTKHLGNKDKYLDQTRAKEWLRSIHDKGNKGTVATMTHVVHLNEQPMLFFFQLTFSSLFLAVIL